MGRGSKSQKKIQQEIAHLEAQKKIGMLRAVAAFLGLFILIALKTTFQMQGQEWANSMIVNMGLFILALVAAGVAGLGTRKWTLARKEIAQLEKKLK